MKGFTLMELLGSIVIIGIISAITFPIVTGIIVSNEQKAYDLQEEQIKSSAKNMIIQGLISIPNDGESVTISIGEIKRNSLLPITMINPKTKKTISNESTVLITRENNSYIYQVNLLDLSENSVQNQNAPVIRLNGSYIEYIEINTSYNELGAIAFSNTGEELEVGKPQILLNDIEVGSIDVTHFNTYKLIYSITDKGVTTTSIRTVVVRDTISPIISVPTVSQIKVSEVNGFNVDSGVYAIDNSNESITVTSTSTLSNIPGTYVITYMAKDSSNNESNLRRIITVVSD